ncbi:MAG: beta-lactamase family protein [Chlorobi bacterium]|nr:beta-lactamase family protein [Chlorobiota bacterium]
MNLFLKTSVVWFLAVSLLVGACKKDNNNEPALTEILKAKCDSVVLNTNVPGMVVGVWDSEHDVNFVYATGIADVAQSIPMDDEMLFRIGSNTKTFTNTVMLQLVDDGLISTEDMLSKYVPDFPHSDEITMRMLGDMRSGIHSYTDTEEFYYEWLNNPLRVWTTDELLDISSKYPLLFEPGDSFNYSNSNTVMIGKVIEILTGNTLKQEIHRRIIDKLDLQHTTYHASGSDMPGHHAHGYFTDDFDPAWPDVTEAWDVSWAQAAGGMVSNIHDLKIYVEALVEGGLLSDSLQQLRLNSFYTIRGDSAYGIGLFKVHSFIGHNGGIEGYTSVMLHSLEKDATIIILYNCKLSAHRPDDLFLEFLNTLYPGEF